MTEFVERFWSKTSAAPGALASPCLLWTASRDTAGYGHVKVGARLRGAHRVAYELAFGPVPDGLELDHLCRDRACVNPRHLEPVTHAENVRRGAAPAAVKGNRWNRGERQWAAKLTTKDVIAIRAARAEGLTLKKIAEAYGIGPDQVSRIANGKRWGHVPLEHKQ